MNNTAFEIISNDLKNKPEFFKIIRILMIPSVGYLLSLNKQSIEY
jgi:hypothetical protein